MSQREQQHGGQHSTAASGRRSATAEKARGSVPVLQAAGDSQESAPGTPTREEFEEARERELARLLRLSSLAPQTLSAEQQGLLEHDTPQLSAGDRDTVRRWAASRHAERPGAC
ncbi:MAG: hypothetical protein H0V53_05240 [Rubrobacter sp.]|nr:hypothetical protein [Rubrobacter sp.]